MKNLNLIFNKLYYGALGTGTFRGSQTTPESAQYWNAMIFGTAFSQRDYRQLSEGLKSIGVKTFALKTVYPGLLIGSGNLHGAGKLDGLGSDDDIKIGFYFDYVSGQPYIPGSSVKGALRTNFRNHPEALAEILKEAFGMQLPEDDAKKIIKAFDTEIFGSSAEDNDEGDSDIFFDAVIRKGGSDGKMLATDYITPHGDGLVNPIPVLFIKVLPGVEFEFRFLTRDTTVNVNGNDYTLTAENKIDLFRLLLMLFGVGAKTNVGYGILAPADNTQQEDTTQSTQQTAANRHGVYTADIKTSETGVRYFVCPKCGTKNYETNNNRKNASWKEGKCRTPDCDARFNNLN